MSKQSSRGPAWEALRLATLNRDGWICTYCGKALEGDDATADHIIPKNRGGADELSNLRAACRRCNGEKSDKDLTRITYINTKWLSHA